MLIREFQPALKDWNLVSAVYLIVWVLVIVGGFLAEKGHSEESQDERSQPEKSQPERSKSEKAMARGVTADFLPIPGLFLLFAAAAAMQIKYMPFFAVVSGVALCKYCLPELCWRSSNRRVGELEQNQLVTPGLGIKFGCFLAAFSLVMLCGLKLDLMKPGLEAAALALPGDSDGIGGSSIAQRGSQSDR